VTAKLNGLRIERTFDLFSSNNDGLLLGDPPYEWMRKVWMEGKEIEVSLMEGRRVEGLCG
jgi:hypothetical protein